ncbi:hypothetical protein [Mesorhizobium sp. A623]
MKLRIFLSIIAPLVLSSCGSCNMLGGSQPAHCDAGLVAGAVVAAPVLIPMAIADDAKARSAPVRPVKKFEPKTEREKELYRTAGGK